MARAVPRLIAPLIDRQAVPPTVLRALWSYWRRNPIQLAALLAGLAIATALWSGVQALNAEARASYDRAAATVGGGAPRLVDPQGGRIDESVWAALRRAGWPVSPFLEGTVEIGGESYRLVGVDPLSLPANENLDLTGAPGDDGDGDGQDGDGDGFSRFILPPFATLAAPGTIDALGGPDVTPGTDDGLVLPRLEARMTLAEGLLVVDIGVAQRVLGAEGALSALLLGDRAAPRTPLAETAGAGLDRVEPEAPADLERLTASFHMNLTAFGLLSFLVGLFIVHAAIGLAFEQRRGLFRTLRAMGVSARDLAAALLLEIVTVAIVAGAVGLIGGWLLAAALMPDIAVTLEGLYGADVPGSLALRPAWWAAGLAMALAGALAAGAQSLWRAYRLPVLTAAAPQAWAEAQDRWLRRQGIAAAALALAAVLLPVLLDGLVAGFATLGALVLAAALALPLLAAAALRFAERLAAPGLARWFWADTRQQLSGLTLALMALLLALSVNIGVGTMVESFRTTFTGWIGDRLAADAYYRAETPEEAARLAAWLETRPEVQAILPNYNADTRIDAWPVEVYGFADDPLYRRNWPLLAQSDGAWDALGASTGIMISEQMSYRLDLDLGDGLVLPGTVGSRPLEVVAIYADYGNPAGQVRIAADLLHDLFPDVERLRFGLRVEDGATPALVAAMRTEFGLGLERLRDQESLEALSLAIFNRTFVVTGALNTLTLAVAGVALLTSLVTLSSMRLPSLAPVWATGLTRARLGGLELLKMLCLALVTAAAAVPVGLAIAWLLVSVINVEAFGWRLPLHLFPLDWARLGLLALATAALASALPVWRLSRMAPARLIAVFAAAR
ncbi:MAG: ABC transporter permease [Pseudomonadota bacterium]